MSPPSGFIKRFVAPKGTGKSFFLKQHADQDGISYEEAVLCSKPTEEMLAKRRNLDEEQQLKNAKRLQAVRDAYWLASDYEEFYCIHDSCTEFLAMDLAKDQLRLIFNILPSDIIGSGIKWGFYDTEVREKIYCYIRDNAEVIKILLGGQLE